jgi:hypothetical protein
LREVRKSEKRVRRSGRKYEKAESEKRFNRLVQHARSKMGRWPVPQRHDLKFRKAREQAEAEVARQQVEVARQCEQEEEAREQAEAEAARQHEEVARQAREQEEAEAARQQEEVARQQAVVARQQVEVTAARQQARQVELVLKTAMNPGDWFLNRAGRLPRLRGAVADAGRSGLPSIQQLLSRAKVVLSLEEGEGASSAVLPPLSTVLW